MREGTAAYMEAHPELHPGRAPGPPRSVPGSSTHDLGTVSNKSMLQPDSKANAQLQPSETRKHRASSPSDERNKSKPLPPAAGAHSVKQGPHGEPNTVRAEMHPALLHGKTRSHHTLP